MSRPALVLLGYALVLDLDGISLGNGLLILSRYVAGHGEQRECDSGEHSCTHVDLPAVAGSNLPGKRQSSVKQCSVSGITLIPAAGLTTGAFESAAI